MTVRLFTSAYAESNPVRRQELAACLQNNLALKTIDQICLLVEAGADAPGGSDKLLCRTVNRRPRYQDFFLWANELCGSQADISIIANSDIFFDKTLEDLARLLTPLSCAALSRWDLQPDGKAVLFDRNDSQDAWVFSGSIRSVSGDFYVGVPRCDNRILYELRQAGYQVINPAFSVRAMHLHSGIRTEYPAEITGLFVPPPYEYLFPHNLVSLPLYLAGRLTGRYSSFRWRLDPRLILRWSVPRVLRRVASRLRNTLTAAFSDNR